MRRQKPTSAARPLPPAWNRTLVSLFIPPVLGGILASVAQRLAGGGGNPLAVTAVFLGGIGLASVYLGLNWYGTAGMGLRGGRPFFAGAGFAFLGWVALLGARFVLVDIDQAAFLQNPLLTDFAYLLLFEAFAVQLWTFGLLFRSVADWRGPQTAAVAGGITFAGAAFLVFQESFAPVWQAVPYFLVWGIFYGVVRLRTGSLIGLVLVQAMQSLTAWFLFLPPRPFDPARFNALLFTYVGIWYAVLIWRLWPREREDYRV